MNNYCPDVRSLKAFTFVVAKRPLCRGVRDSIFRWYRVLPYILHDGGLCDDGGSGVALLCRHGLVLRLRLLRRGSPLGRGETPSSSSASWRGRLGVSRGSRGWGGGGVGRGGELIVAALPLLCIRVVLYWLCFHALS